MKHTITSFLDFFYTPFRSFVPLITFRYAVCGGFTTVMGLASYFVGYQYLFAKKNFDIGFYAFKPHMAALFVSFCVSFSVGFLLNKFVVFVDSNIKGRIQLFRYFLSVSLNLVINYLLLKLFVELFRWNVLISQFITTCFIIAVSYVSQKHFSFRVKK